MMGRGPSTRDWATHMCTLFKMADDNGKNESPDQIKSLRDEGGGIEFANREVNGDIEEGPAKGGSQLVLGSSKKKKKKKKGKSDEGSDTAVESLPSPAVNLQNLRELQKSFERLRAAEVKAPKTTEEAMKKKYQFWDTQPVPKLGGFL